MNRGEWIGIILGTSVLALGVYAGLIILGALTERSAGSADACLIRNRGKVGFKVHFQYGGQKLIHSRSMGQVPAGPITIESRAGRRLKRKCPPGQSLDIVDEGRRIAVTSR